MATPEGSQGRFLLGGLDPGTTDLPTGQTVDGEWWSWTSPDGATGSKAARLPGELDEITTYPGGVVGVGETANAEDGSALANASADGTTWNMSTLAVSGLAEQVATGPGGRVMGVGIVRDTTGSGTPTIWTSINGIDWTDATFPGIGAGEWQVLAATCDADGFVLGLGDPGTTPVTDHVWWSPDGIAWSETQSGSLGTFSAATSDGSTYLLLGRGRQGWSGDGTDRTIAPDQSLSAWSVADLASLTDGRELASGFVVTESSVRSALFLGTTAAP